MKLPDGYTETPEVKAISKPYLAQLRQALRIDQADMDRWQLDLLYHHLPRMDEETSARARSTIATLENRVVGGYYPSRLGFAASRLSLSA